MPGADSSETTQLLRDWANGDREALEKLMPRVYDELRRIAGHLMRAENAGRTIQTTALVHEAYLKLIDVTAVDWQHRSHFFAICAQIMRRILIDQSRRRLASKRGGGELKLNVDDRDIGSEPAREIIQLNDALNALEKMDARKAKVIELRFFAGLSVDETAEVLKVSSDTVLRDWRLGRAWLLSQLESQ